MNTLIIEHVSPKVLPSEWVRRLHLLPEQTVTVRIETDADTVSAEQGGDLLPMTRLLAFGGILPRRRTWSIIGLRITVYDVLAMLSSGMTHQEIQEDFPELTQEDILAVLSYAAEREHQVYWLKAQ